MSFRGRKLSNESSKYASWVIYGDLAAQEAGRIVGSLG
jgi:hypothetical protein